MSAILEIVTAASDLALLTAAELRAAAGLAAGDTSEDSELAALGLEAAEYIAGICRVATVGTNTPTLRSESLRETFRLTGCAPVELILARRFVTVSSVSENGTALVSGTDYIVHTDAGIVERILSDKPRRWLTTGTTVIEYSAGFGTVPAIIKAVATDYVRMRLSQEDRDPLVRSETVEGVDSVTYRDGAAGAADFDAHAESKLARFVNYANG